ncbi:hypothetical protein Pst134EA_004829 [Puccinia striiformis f. sp. tritici]|uniref:hypothetical protein n=1 Tax=Puccinia striiformis f. sp. tritici TaxID=168172 RepID=UPI00200728F5|nr:hypothetical protein Pst134EA_004829 [Puccinia striiformis f. sp. tritici]KAH9470918.1 hypothetical protein Pst134EA_004829 [Puccinia striiformis f. sp. tritici]
MEPAPRSLKDNRFLAKAKIRNNQIMFKGDSGPVELEEPTRKRTRDASNNNNNNNQGKSTATENKESLKPLPKRIRKFVDYDLSTMKNSKGGFLLDNEQDDPRKLKEKLQIEELKKQRLAQVERLNRGDPNLSLDKTQNPKCKVCGSVELDLQFFQVFKVSVCRKCKNDHPERFSLLTKTECKQDYLLTDPELKDSDLLPHLLKANPHQSTYSNMMLYLREQVEEYAFSDCKWGSAELLDQEFNDREQAKKDTKNKKFEAQLKDLRKKTRSNVWHKRQDAVHVHDFVVTSSSSTNTQIQKCAGCGLTNEVETF